METLPDIQLDDVSYSVASLPPKSCVIHLPELSAQVCVVRNGSCWFECPEFLDHPLFIPDGGIVGSVGNAAQVWRSDLEVASDNARHGFELTELAEAGNHQADQNVNLLIGRTSMSSSILLPAFPPVFYISPEEQKKIPHVTMVLEMVEYNARHPSELEHEGLIQKASEILTIMLVRFIKKQLSSSNPNWPNVATDSQFMRTLKLMESDASKKWTIDMLAREAGMSRSSFAAKFKSLVGDTPANYLARVRMRNAKKILREGRRSIIDIATSVGYDSELGFVKAFRRQYCLSPSQYRAQTRHK